MHASYTVLLLPGIDDHGYTVLAPLLPGCVTEGSMLSEALANAAEAISAFLRDMRLAGEPPPAEPMPAVVLERALAQARAILRADAEDAGRPDDQREPVIATVTVDVVGAGAR